MPISFCRPNPVYRSSPQSCVIEHKVNSSVVGREWYEKTSSELRLWGEDFGDFYGFSNSLLLAWYPLKVNDQKYSSATVRIEGLVFDISVTVVALTREWVALGFDTLNAFKLRYVIRIWGHGIDQIGFLLERFCLYKVRQPADRVTDRRP